MQFSYKVNLDYILFMGAGFSFPAGLRKNAPSLYENCIQTILHHTSQVGLVFLTLSSRPNFFKTGEANIFIMVDKDFENWSNMLVYF